VCNYPKDQIKRLKSQDLTAKILLLSSESMQNKFHSLPVCVELRSLRALNTDLKLHRQRHSDSFIPVKFQYFNLSQCSKRNRTLVERSVFKYHIDSHGTAFVKLHALRQ
jgi:hypothetical protein